MTKTLAPETYDLEPELPFSLDKSLKILYRADNIRVDNHNSFHSVNYAHPPRKFYVIGKVSIEVGQWLPEEPLPENYDARTSDYPWFVDEVYSHRKLKRLDPVLIGKSHYGFDTKEKAQRFCNRFRHQLHVGYIHDVTYRWLRLNAPTLSIVEELNRRFPYKI